MQVCVCVWVGGWVDVGVRVCIWVQEKASEERALVCTKRVLTKWRCVCVCVCVCVYVCVCVHRCTMCACVSTHHTHNA